MFYVRRETFLLMYPSLWPSGIPDAGSVRLLWKSQCGKKRYCICILLLFCFVVTLGCLLPLVHFLSWIPTKKTSSATSFSPLFHLPAQSIFALLLMEITLSCLLQSQRTRDKNPSSVLGGFCEDIVTVFSHCHSSGLCEEASALHSHPPRLTLRQIAGFPTRCESF